MRVCPVVESVEFAALVSEMVYAGTFRGQCALKIKTKNGLRISTIKM